VLLQLGSNCSAVNLDGDTPLHKACLHGSKDIARILLTAGAHVSPRSQLQSTPLHYAASRGHWELLKFLLQNDVSTADMNEQTSSGNTILHIAAECGQEALVDHLLTDLYFPGDAINDMGDSALHIAAAKGHGKIIYHLLESGVDAKKRNSRGQTARAIAELKGQWECAARLRARERAG